jgi:uncharacterized membrane protein
MPAASPATPSRSAFLLAHHHPEDYRRCFAIRGRHVCARCISLYPVLVTVLASQIAFKAASTRPWELWVVVGLTLPAFVDWARGRFDPRTGSNWVRMTTGVLIGVALSRMVYLNMVRPANTQSVVYFLSLGILTMVVETIARPYRLKVRLAQRDGDS